MLTIVPLPLRPHWMSSGIHDYLLDDELLAVDGILGLLDRYDGHDRRICLLVRCFLDHQLGFYGWYVVLVISDPALRLHHVLLALGSVC